MFRVILITDGPPFSAEELLSTNDTRVVGAMRAAASSVISAVGCNPPPSPTATKPMVVLSVPDDQSGLLVELTPRQVFPSIKELAGAIGTTVGALRVRLTDAARHGCVSAESRGVRFCRLKDIEIADKED